MSSSKIQNPQTASQEDSGEARTGRSRDRTNTGTRATSRSSSRARNDCKFKDDCEELKATGNCKFKHSQAAMIKARGKIECKFKDQCFKKVLGKCNFKHGAGWIMDKDKARGAEQAYEKSRERSEKGQGEEKSETETTTPATLLPGQNARPPVTEATSLKTLLAKIAKQRAVVDREKSKLDALLDELNSL